jgi:hypothetical protein
MSGKLFRIFLEVSRERKRQDEKWGEQNHPMRGLGDDNIIKRGSILCPEDSTLKNALSTFRYRNETKKAGWFDILQEEICEAFLETEPEKQREEMIQVAAVAVQIIECLDRRIKDETTSDCDKIVISANKLCDMLEHEWEQGDGIPEADSEGYFMACRVLGRVPKWINYAGGEA